MALKNTYVYCPLEIRKKGRIEREPARVWDPTDVTDRPLADCYYFGGILTHLENSGAFSGLTFVLTWSVSKLPSYDSKTVVFLLGDERARYPAYASRVAAVFKEYGLSRRPAWPPRLSEYWVASVWQESLLALSSLQYAGLRMRDALLGKARRVWDVPLGYYNQRELPITPIRERSCDVFFAGSMAKKSIKAGRYRWLSRVPKEISRQKMAAVLEDYAASRPDRSVLFATTAGFWASTKADPDDYSAALMKAKICLAPRGTSLETFRWFEGMRYGCVVICERLPERRYYTGSPAITVDDWSELPRVLDDLLADPGRIEALSAAALEWWRTQCSEPAVADFVAQRLRQMGLGGRDANAVSQPTVTV